MIDIQEIQLMGIMFFVFVGMFNKLDKTEQRLSMAMLMCQLAVFIVWLLARYFT